MSDKILEAIVTQVRDSKIPFEDCRGQAYDNGAIMKGKHQGIQARLLKKDPRGVFVPCGAHTLNLVIADAAKSSKDAVVFFWACAKALHLLFSWHTKMECSEETHEHNCEVME